MKVQSFWMKTWKLLMVSLKYLIQAQARWFSIYYPPNLFAEQTVFQRLPSETIDWTETELHNLHANKRVKI